MYIYIYVFIYVLYMKSFILQSTILTKITVIVVKFLLDYLFCGNKKPVEEF